MQCGEFAQLRSERVTGWKQRWTCALPTCFHVLIFACMTELVVQKEAVVNLSIFFYVGVLTHKQEHMFGTIVQTLCCGPGSGSHADVAFEAAIEMLSRPLEGLLLKQLIMTGSHQATSL